MTEHSQNIINQIKSEMRSIEGELDWYYSRMPSEEETIELLEARLRELDKELTEAHADYMLVNNKIQ
tara:strand:- start:2118 stop:2318 length:201 start_codon:yes stop_codon:yes gene_type:complete